MDWRRLPNQVLEIVCLSNQVLAMTSRNHVVCLPRCHFGRHFVRSLVERQSSTVIWTKLNDLYLDSFDWNYIYEFTVSSLSILLSGCLNMLAFPALSVRRFTCAAPLSDCVTIVIAVKLKAIDFRVFDQGIPNLCSNESVIVSFSIMLCHLYLIDLISYVVTARSNCDVHHISHLIYK